eukprot:1157304-Pelagomonas_calceolata.AAC.3
MDAFGMDGTIGHPTEPIIFPDRDGCVNVTEPHVLSQCRFTGRRERSHSMLRDRKPGLGGCESSTAHATSLISWGWTAKSQVSSSQDHPTCSKLHPLKIVGLKALKEGIVLGSSHEGNAGPQGLETVLGNVQQLWKFCQSKWKSYRVSLMDSTLRMLEIKCFVYNGDLLTAVQGTAAGIAALARLLQSGSTTTMAEPPSLVSPDSSQADDLPDPSESVQVLESVRLGLHEVPHRHKERYKF